MARRRLDLLDDAAGEIEAATDWYLQHSATAAEGFVADLEYAFQAILDAPERWPVRKHGVVVSCFVDSPTQ